MFAELKGYLIYMVYGLLIFFFVVITPEILKSVFLNHEAEVTNKYSKSTLQKVDKTIKLFNFLGSPLGGRADDTSNQGVLAGLAVTAVIYMFVAFFITLVFYKVFLPLKRKDKPIRRM